MAQLSPTKCSLPVPIGQGRTRRGGDRNVAAPSCTPHHRFGTCDRPISRKRTTAHRSAGRCVPRNTSPIASNHHHPPSPTPATTFCGMFLPAPTAHVRDNILNRSHPPVAANRCGSRRLILTRRERRVHGDADLEQPRFKRGRARRPAPSPKICQYNNLPIRQSPITHIHNTHRAPPSSAVRCLAVDHADLPIKS